MPPFESNDFWERIAENLKHPPAPLPAWEPARRPTPRASDIPTTAPMPRRAPAVAFEHWTASETSSWRTTQHFEHRRGRSRFRVKTGRPPGRQADPMVPSMDTVKSMVRSRIGPVSGGRKLRVRALIALVAGLGISVSDALRIYPDDLRALKLPRWAWTPIRQLLRVRDSRWIGRSSPVLCKTRFGSAGQPWDAHEALRAWSYFQRCFCGRVVFTLSGVRRVHGYLSEAEKVRMRPVFED